MEVYVRIAHDDDALCNRQNQYPNQYLNHCIPFFARGDLVDRVPMAQDEKHFEVGFVWAHFVV